MIDEARAERMRPILDRIPEEWGKSLPWPEWDGLLLDLDAKLAAIDPDYTVLQAKVKFDELRYYISTDVGPEQRAEMDLLIAEAERRTGQWLA